MTQRIRVEDNSPQLAGHERSNLVLEANLQGDSSALILATRAINDIYKDSKFSIVVEEVRTISRLISEKKAFNG